MDAKDMTTVSSVKQEIRALKKQKAELLAAKDSPKVKRIRRQIKFFKRLTRQLSRKARAEAKPAAAPESSGQATPAA
jgi:hypothetical protein